MRRAARIVSMAALVLTILPPILFFGNRMDVETMKTWMLGAAVVWFASVPLWMKK